MLLPEGPSNPCCWADEVGTVVWDPRMATTGDPLLPKPVGTLQEGDKRRVIHSADGPCCTIRWPGDELLGPGATLVHVAGRGRGRIRP